MSVIDTIFLVLSFLGVGVLCAFYVGQRSQDYFAKKYPLAKVEIQPQPKFPKELLKPQYEYQHTYDVNLMTSACAMTCASYYTGARLNPTYQASIK